MAASAIATSNAPFHVVGHSMGGRADHSIMDPLAAMVSSYTIDDYVGQVTALLGRRDLRALLPTITCPTLVVCGQQDAWSTVEQHEALAERIPDARLEIVED